ncbi:MAG: NERD domain-containing protein [Nitrospirae bacterium]|nr:NERD domain-containing protein [Nitrospirota bacterium]
MAIFYPPFDTDESRGIERTGYHAEKRVLDALSDLNDDWRIFHNLAWREIDQRSGERSGEIDLIIFHPDLGVLVVEVKGGGVKLQDGEWYYVSLFDGSVVSRMHSPIEQAGRSRYYLFDRLKKTPIGQEFLKSTVFTHTAWFPDITWTEDVPPEVPHNGFVLDSRHLKNCSNHLRNIMRQSSPNPAPWSRSQIDSLIRSLAPEVNMLPPLGVVLGTIKDNLYRMTEGQIKTLRALRMQKRLLVEGCAGSGKTLLAVRLAHDHINDGKKVLFTCFNKNLAEYVAFEFQGNERIDVLNFHELVKRLCERHAVTYEVPDEEEMKRHFFDTGCAELLEKTSEFIAHKYDTIIVDEALDFKDTWWISLESLGADNHSYYVFYDRNQNLYNESGEWNAPFMAEPFVLEQNVRNTKPIGDFALKIGNIPGKAQYAVNEGPKPEVKYYSDINEVPVLLKGLLDDLLRKQKVSPDEIVVLSPYKYDNQRAGIKQMIEEGKDLFTTDMVKKGQGKIRVGTIQSFKGLEADVVILCSIDGHLPACKPSNLYVGATRARALLWVLKKKE